MKKAFIGVLTVAVFFGGVAWSNISHAEGSSQGNNPSISEILSMLKTLEARVNELSGRTQIVFPQKKEKEFEKKEKESEKSELKPTLYPMPVLPSGGFITLDELQGNPRVSCALPSLEPRASGNSVYLLQLVLKQEGSYPEGLITGFYGKLTQQAVRAFQGRNGLTVNGVVDRSTAAILNDYVKKFYPNECRDVTPIPTTDKFFGTLYSAGATAQMWGTHTLVIEDGDSSPVPMMYGQSMPLKVKPSNYKRYLVKAANDSVLADLKNAEGKKVVLWGTIAYQNLEGGFWGIVAEKVYPQVVEPPKPAEIKVYAPSAWDTWKPGETYVIRWTAPPALPTVNPQYLETVTITLQPPIPACVNATPPCMIPIPVPYSITTSTINDGSYEWQIPSSLIPLYQGRQQITVAVNGRNLSGTSAEFNIAKESSSNKPPVIIGVGGPATISLGTAGTWTVSAYDPDGNNLAYNVNWGDYIPNAYGAPESKKMDQTATFTHTYSAAGFYTIIFTVVDEKGASARSTLTVTAIGKGSTSTSTVSTCATSTKIVRRYALNTSEFGDLGLATILHPEIVRYRIRWFSGGWSDWYTPGVNDVDWKVNDNGTQRRVWAYFGDHEHEFEQCGGVSMTSIPASAALIEILQKQLNAMGAQARDLLER
ncbi:MAG: peptidoglycan-binding protein [Patescibacteria group bacterium]